jgi:hypothetical protein
VSRERFAADVAAMAPGVNVLVPNPGDRIDLSGGDAEIVRQAAGFVRTLEDDAAERMFFDPSSPKPELRDDDPDGRPEAELVEGIRSIWADRIPAGARRFVGPLHPLRLMEAKIEVRVVFPSGRTDRWTVALDRQETRVTPGAAGDEADFVHTVTASGLCDLVSGRTRPDILILTGQMRSFSRAYRIDGGHLVMPEQIAPLAAGDPLLRRIREQLFWFLGCHERDWELRQVDAEIDRLLGQNGALWGSPLWARPEPKLRARGVAGLSSDVRALVA